MPTPQTHWIGPALATPSAVADTPPAADPPRVDGYTVRRPLGRGGMGQVYEADQHDPPRRVALKLILGGGFGADAVARFAVERQAVARMDHPNVARVYDAGVTAAGVPYFAMELVGGPPLTTYCDAHRLGVRERLGLFAGVCRAVQHAHQKGVVHRDLKPANVLVTEVDGVPAPKVIDFGVAKLVGEAGGGASVTRFGLVAGTPLYMAPEQADPFAHVDTRADVYSLGVILFELLTGRTPLDATELDRLPPSEVLRRVSGQTPVRPTTAVQVGRAAGGAARVPTADLPAELDWVVLRCLQADPGERYPTADQLAADVDRYLRGEAVSAHPPSRWYVARKFVRRHRGPVAAVVAMLALLVTGVVGTTVGLLEARAQERRAEANAADSQANERAALAAKAEAERAKARAEAAAANERAANDRTRKQFDQLQTTNRILTDVFIRLNPNAETDGRPLQSVLGEQLVRAADLLDGEAIGDPLAVAHMQLKLGLSVSNLGHQKSALEVLGKAHRTFARALGPDSREALRAEFCMADCHRLSGNVPRATEWHDDVRARRAAALGGRDPDTLASLNNLAICYRVAGKSELAVPLYEHILQASAEDQGPDHPDTLNVANNLGVAYTATARYRVALPHLERVLDARRQRLPEDHVDVLVSLNNLAECLRRMGEYDRARPLYEQGRRLGANRHGAENPLVVSLTFHLGLNYLNAGQPDLALPLLAEAYQRRKVRSGTGHADTLEALTDLIQAASRLRHQDAVPLCNEMVAQKRKGMPADDPRLATTLVWAGWQLLRGGQPAAAEGYLREGLALREKHTPASWGVPQTRSLLGEALLDQRKYADAEPLLGTGYAGLKERAADIPGILRRARVEEALDRLLRWAELTGTGDLAETLQAERARLPRGELPRPRKAD